MEFAIKTYENGEDSMLAVADFKILGNSFSSDDKILEVKKDFYYKEKCDEIKLKEIVHNFTIINAVGNETISLLIEENIIDKENVIKIDGVPHAQYIKI